MILDSLKNSALYENVNPRMKKAFALIASTDWTKMEPGIHELDGKDIYVNVMERELKQKSDAKLEVHNEYIDIQVLVTGKEETFGWSERKDLRMPQGGFDRRPIIRCVRVSSRCFSPRTATLRWWARERCARSSSKCANKRRRRYRYGPEHSLRPFFVRRRGVLRALASGRKRKRPVSGREWIIRFLPRTCLFLGFVLHLNDKFSP